MKHTITKTIETEVEITPPLFWRNPMSDTTTEVVAYIDERTAVQVFHQPDRYTSVTNSEPHLSKIKEAFNKWVPISEEEFFEVLEMANRITNLKPIYHETIAL